MLRIYKRNLAFEYDVYDGGNKTGITIDYSQTRKEYPGREKVNYTAEEWEDEVNASVGFLRLSHNTNLAQAIFDAFVTFSYTNYINEKRRYDQYVERGAIFQSEFPEYVAPKGIAYFENGRWVLVTMVAKEQ